MLNKLLFGVLPQLPLISTPESCARISATLASRSGAHAKVSRDQSKPACQHLPTRPEPLVSLIRRVTGGYDFARLSSIALRKASGAASANDCKCEESDSHRISSASSSRSRTKAVIRP